ncbi:MAG: hypothetical protein KBH14_08065 [Vicinamibacteria bacterium]|nr:hypothetical protein [Vicinamibacteria bacterium]
MELARQTRHSVRVVSPFITTAGVEILVRSLPDVALTISICSRFDRAGFAQGSSDFAALELLNGWSPSWTVKFFRLRRLHAKVFLFDSRCLVTSANLTQGGLRTNFEFGLSVSDLSLVPGLAQAVDRIYEDSKAVTIEEIAAQADRPSPAIRPYLSPDVDHEEISAPSAINAQEDDHSPKTDVTPDEAERALRFWRRLDERLDRDANTPPFGTLEVFSGSAEEVSSGRAQQPVASAANRDLQRIREYISARYAGVATSSFQTAGLEALFVHKSWQGHFLGTDGSDPAFRALLAFESAGRDLLTLFALEHQFSGNYRFPEKIGFFAGWAQECIRSLAPAALLQDAGANWCIHYGDLPKDWRHVHLKCLLGILAADKVESAWSWLREHLDLDWMQEAKTYDSTEWRTVLQEAVIACGGRPPEYVEIGRSGPDHKPEFRAQASALGRSREGNGANLKGAKTEAARLLLEHLRSEGVIPAGAQVRSRGRVAETRPYRFDESRYGDRLRGLRRILLIDAPDRFVDCALTTQRERTSAPERPSNEKFALAGSFLRSLGFDLWRARTAMGANVDVVAKSLTGPQYVRLFGLLVPGFEEFQKRFYADSTSSEVLTLCDALTGLLWKAEGWRILRRLGEVFSSQERGLYSYEEDARAVLQELRQENGLSLPAYRCYSRGPGHQAEWFCEVFLDGRRAGEGGPCSSQAKARTEAAKNALAELAPSNGQLGHS